MSNVDELLPSAADCNKKMALAEAEKASEQMRKQAQNRTNQEMAEWEAVALGVCPSIAFGP